MTKNGRKWHGLLAIVLCFVLSISFTACGKIGGSSSGSGEGSSSESSTSDSSTKPIVPPTKNYPAGDINFDEKVNLDDVNLFVAYVFSENTYYYGKNAADVVKNGVLNMADLRYIWNRVNGREGRRDYSTYASSVATGKGDVNGDGVINASDVWDWIDYYTANKKGGYPKNPYVTIESCNITGDKDESNVDIVDSHDLDALLSMSDVDLIDKDYLSKLERAASTLGVRALSMATEQSDPDFYHQFYDNAWEQWYVLSRWMLYYLVGYFGSEDGQHTTFIEYDVYDDDTRLYFLDYGNEHGTITTTVEGRTPEPKITEGETTPTEADIKYNNAALAIERQVINIVGAEESRTLPDSDVSDYEHVTVYKEDPLNPGQYIIDAVKTGDYPKFSQEKLDAQLTLLNAEVKQLEPNIITQHWLMSFTSLNPDWTIEDCIDGYNSDYINKFSPLIALNFLEHYLAQVAGEEDNLTLLADWAELTREEFNELKETLVKKVKQVEIDTEIFSEEFLADYIRKVIIGEEVIENDSALSEIDFSELVNKITYSYNKYSDFTLETIEVPESSVTTESSFSASSMPHLSLMTASNAPLLSIPSAPYSTNFTTSDEKEAIAKVFSFVSANELTEHALSFAENAQFNSTTDSRLKYVNAIFAINGDAFFPYKIKINDLYDVYIIFVVDSQRVVSCWVSCDLSKIQIEKVEISGLLELIGAGGWTTKETVNGVEYLWRGCSEPFSLASGVVNLIGTPQTTFSNVINQLDKTGGTKDKFDALVGEHYNEHAELYRWTSNSPWRYNYGDLGNKKTGVTTTYAAARGGLLGIFESLGLSYTYQSYEERIVGITKPFVLSNNVLVGNNVTESYYDTNVLKLIDDGKSITSNVIVDFEDSADRNALESFASNFTSYNDNLWPNAGGGIYNEWLSGYNSMFQSANALFARTTFTSPTNNFSSERSTWIELMNTPYWVCYGTNYASALSNTKHPLEASKFVARSIFGINGCLQPDNFNRIFSNTSASAENPFMYNGGMWIDGYTYFPYVISDGTNCVWVILIEKDGHLSAMFSDWGQIENWLGAKPFVSVSSTNINLTVYGLEQLFDCKEEKCVTKTSFFTASQIKYQSCDCNVLQRLNGIFNYIEAGNPYTDERGLATITSKSLVADMPEGYVSYFSNVTTFFGFVKGDYSSQWGASDYWHAEVATSGAQGFKMQQLFSAYLNLYRNSNESDLLKNSYILDNMRWIGLNKPFMLSLGEQENLDYNHFTLLVAKLLGIDNSEYLVSTANEFMELYTLDYNNRLKYDGGVRVNDYTIFPYCITQDDLKVLLVITIDNTGVMSAWIDDYTIAEIITRINETNPTTTVTNTLIGRHQLFESDTGLVTLQFYISSDNIITKTVTKGSYVSVENPTKEGTQFIGWFDSRSGGNEIDLTTTVFTANQTIYAHFLENPITITFDSMGGTSVAPQTIERGSVINSAPFTEKANYVFKGWYLSSTSDDYKVNFPSNFGGDTTLYAHWVEKITINLNYDGGKYSHLTSDEACCGKGETVTITREPGKDHYLFKGWALQGSSDVLDLSTYKFYENTTLVARYYDAVKVTFKAYSWYQLKSQSVLKFRGDMIEDERYSYTATPPSETQIENAASSSSIFGGWFMYPEDLYPDYDPADVPIEDKIFVDDFDTRIYTVDTNFYAYWKESVCISFIDTYEVNSNYYVDIEKGTRVTLPSFTTRTSIDGENYILYGWYTDLGETGEKIDFYTRTFDEDTSLYANWRKESDVPLDELDDYNIYHELKEGHITATENLIDENGIKNVDVFNNVAESFDTMLNGYNTLFEEKNDPDEFTRIRMNSSQLYIKVTEANAKLFAKINSQFGDKIDYSHNALLTMDNNLGFYYYNSADAHSDYEDINSFRRRVKRVWRLKADGSNNVNTLTGSLISFLPSSEELIKGAVYTNNGYYIYPYLYSNASTEIAVLLIITSQKTIYAWVSDFNAVESLTDEEITGTTSTLYGLSSLFPGLESDTELGFDDFNIYAELRESSPQVMDTTAINNVDIFNDVASKLDAFLNVTDSYANKITHVGTVSTYRKLNNSIAGLFSKADNSVINEIDVSKSALVSMTVGVSGFYYNTNNELYHNSNLSGTSDFRRRIKQFWGIALGENVNDLTSKLVNMLDSLDYSDIMLKGAVKTDDHYIIYPYVLSNATTKIAALVIVTPYDEVYTWISDFDAVFYLQDGNEGIDIQSSVTVVDGETQIDGTHATLLGLNSLYPGIYSGKVYGVVEEPEELVTIVINVLQDPPELVTDFVSARPDLLDDGFKLIPLDYEAVISSLVDRMFGKLPVLDERGNPMLDGAGNPIYEPPVFADFPSYNLGIITDVDSYSFFNATPAQKEDQIKKLNNMEARNYSSAVIYPNAYTTFDATTFTLLFSGDTFTTLGIVIRVRSGIYEDLIHVATISFDYSESFDSILYLEGEDRFASVMTNGVIIDLNDYAEYDAIKSYLEKGVTGFLDPDYYPICTFSNSVCRDSGVCSSYFITHDGDLVKLDNLYSNEYSDFIEFVFVAWDGNGNNNFKFAIEYS